MSRRQRNMSCSCAQIRLVKWCAFPIDPPYFNLNFHFESNCWLLWSSHATCLRLLQQKLAIGPITRGSLYIPYTCTDICMPGGPGRQVASARQPIARKRHRIAQIPLIVRCILCRERKPPDQMGYNLWKLETTSVNLSEENAQHEAATICIIFQDMI